MNGESCAKCGCVIDGVAATMMIGSASGTPTLMRYHQKCVPGFSPGDPPSDVFAARTAGLEQQLVEARAEIERLRKERDEAKADLREEIEECQQYVITRPAETLIKNLISGVRHEIECDQRGQRGDNHRFARRDAADAINTRIGRADSERDAALRTLAEVQAGYDQQREAVDRLKALPPPVCSGSGMFPPWGVLTPNGPCPICGVDVQAIGPMGLVATHAYRAAAAEGTKP